MYIIIIGKISSANFFFVLVFFCLLRPLLCSTCTYSYMCLSQPPSLLAHMDCTVHTHIITVHIRTYDESRSVGTVTRTFSRMWVCKYSTIHECMRGVRGNVENLWRNMGDTVASTVCTVYCKNYEYVRWLSHLRTRVHSSTVEYYVSGEVRILSCQMKRCDNHSHTVFVFFFADSTSAILHTGTLMSHFGIFPHEGKCVCKLGDLMQYCQKALKILKFNASCVHSSKVAADTVSPLLRTMTASTYGNLLMPS